MKKTKFVFAMAKWVERRRRIFKILLYYQRVKSTTCICRDTKKTGRSADDVKFREIPAVRRNIQRNYVSENSLQMLKRPSAAPEPKMMDDRKGHTFALEESGWVPKYRGKEDYGQLPMYIQNIDKDLAESREKFRDFLYAEEKMRTPEKMNEKTKQNIYQGLIRNWKELLRRYLLLPVITESPLQLRRKLEIERRIDALEKDIELLIRHEDIFIGKE